MSDDEKIKLVQRISRGPRSTGARPVSDRKCFDCGKSLEWVGSGPGWMNTEQWDASKAGDYFAPCDKATHPNGNCYFNDYSDGVQTLKRKEQGR